VRSIALTAAGRQLYPALRIGFTHIRDAINDLPGAGDARILVVSSSPGFTAKWLAPRLYSFSSAYRRWCIDAWVACFLWGRYVPSVPFKHNAARRHYIPRAHYRVTNWAAYEAGLRRRGDITFWVEEAALAGWQAPRRSTPGGQPHYSDLAIELVLTLRLVFHLGLRQAEGFARSVLTLLGLDLAVLLAAVRMRV